MSQQRKYKDPELYKKYIDFLRAKAQADFRKEGWMLTEEEYFKIWAPTRYSRKGRKIQQLCMTRIDPFGPWCKGNVAVMTRELHFKIRGNRFWNKPHQDLLKLAEFIY